MLPVKTALDVLAHAVALLGAAPLIPHLEAVAQIAFAAALPIGLIGDWRGRHRLPVAAVNLSLLASFLFFGTQVRRDHLVEPAVNLLVLVLAARLLSPKAGRHYLQIFALALFALAASSMVSLSAGFTLFLAIQVPAVIAGLVLLTFHAADERLVLGRRELRRLIPVCLALPAATLPLLLLFFVILPRTSFPLWDFLNPRAAAAGFAESVRPGAFAGLATNAAVAFRAESRELPQSELYWRGIVLNTLEGHAWVRRPPPASESVRLREGLTVRQTIYPEPRPGGYLPALDLPSHIEGAFSRATPDLVQTARTGGRRIRYEAVSSVNGVLEAVGPVDRAFYLQVPAASERVRQAAAAIAEGRDDQEKIERLEGFLRERQLAYATTDLPGPNDPIDVFLFDKKRGYCEFFASSAATLLRLAGVPSRLVGGYLGGEYTALGGYYTVTEEMAHVWVEALVDGREWIRIDPSRLAADAPATLIAARERGRPWGRTLLDALDYYWIRAVITYDMEQQLQLLRRVDRPAADFLPGRRTIWLGAGVALFSILLVLRRRPKAEERLLRAFFRRVRKIHGLATPPAGTGLHEFAGYLPDPRCREFVEIYGGAVFRDRLLTAAERRQLRRVLREMGRWRKSVSMDA